MRCGLKVSLILMYNNIIVLHFVCPILINYSITSMSNR
jgi:hypothetical protein